MITEQRRHQIREEVQRELKRQNDKPTGVWSPTITEAERKEREQQVANGELPF